MTAPYPYPGRGPSRAKRVLVTLWIVARHAVRPRRSAAAPPSSARIRAVRFLFELAEDGRITTAQLNTLMVALRPDATDAEVATIVQRATDLALPSP